jgi:DNA-binding MarR family transcriptional regulator
MRVVTRIIRAMPTPLRDEIKQTKPFASLEQEAHLSVNRTAALLEHTFAEVVRPYGVTPTQYNVLRILQGAGAAGLCRNEVRDRLVARVPDASRLLDRLEEMALVERERDSGDRRLVNTRITAEGRAVLRRLERPVAELHERQFGHLGRAELRALVDVLARVREHE